MILPAFRTIARTPPARIVHQITRNKSSMSAKPAPLVLAEGGETEHGIPLEGKRLQIVKDVMDLFGSKPSLDIFKRGWKEDAVFEDPIAIASGFPQYAAQWFGMPSAFPESETLAWKVIKNEPDLIEYEQRQKYKVAGLGVVKVMESVVHIELDSDEMITRLEDRDGKPMPTGRIANSFRRLNGRTMPSLISVPKTDPPATS